LAAGWQTGGLAHMVRRILTCDPLMLTMFRRFIDTWIAKLLFVVLVASFGLWGVADVVRNIGGSSSLATVGDRKIELPEAQEAYRRQLAQVTRMFGTQITPTPEIRQSVAAQTVERLITSAALDNKVAELGLATPDSAVRQAVFDMPAFKGPNGVFDKATFDGLLRNNGLTENRFLDLVRSDLGQRQLLEAVRASTTASDTMTKAVFGFQREQRVADAVDVPFAAAAAPEPPTEAQLERYYDNNKDHYSSVEFRRIKAVVLAPETLAHEIDISDADIAAAYASRKAEFNTAEKRSVQVLLATDEAGAKRIAEAWKPGVAWADMQKIAADAGGSGVELTNAGKTEFPAPELGEAAFAAPIDTVSAPIQTTFGWDVLKVTAITPGVTKTLAEATPELRARLLAEKASDLLDTRANKIEDALAAGTSLDDLPGDLGLAAITGTLDAQGMTLEGKPAPIPGPAELRPALIQAAFQAKIGDAPHLTQAPNAADGSQSFYAVAVEEIIPPAAKPLAQVMDEVRADWTREAVRHAQEEVAAKILTAVKGGQTLAAASGLTVRTLPAVSRVAAVEGVPTQLIGPLFSLKPGEATMVETPSGFMVAQLAKVIDADPAADPAGFAQMRDQITKQLADDTETVLVSAIRAQANPKVNRAQLDSLAQADQ
jgi:peptidyl-prolyl cis-trans isomerase D